MMSMSVTFLVGNLAMIISLQALRKEEEQRRQQEAERIQYDNNRFNQLSWLQQSQSQQEGILKFVRFLANT